MTKIASLDPNAGLIIIYVNKFGIMKNLLNCENSLPDSTFTGNEGLSKLEIYLSEKRISGKSGCLKPCFVLIWLFSFPYYANSRSFLILLNLLTRKRYTSYHTSLVQIPHSKPRKTNVSVITPPFTTSSPSHFIPSRKFFLYFFCSILVFWPLKNHIGGKNFFEELPHEIFPLGGLQNRF